MAGTFLAPAEDGIIEQYDSLLADAREAEPSNATLAQLPTGEVQASSTTYGALRTYVGQILAVLEAAG